MGGVSGLYFRQFGMTVAVAVFCSLLVARLVTPLMAAYWLKPHQEPTDSSKMRSFYEPILNLALQHRWVTVIIGLICFAGSVALFKALPTSLVSHIDTGYSMVKVELAPGSQLPETLKVIEDITKKVVAKPEVEKVFSIAGTGEVNKGFVNITLKPRDQRKLSQDQFEEALRPEIVRTPGAMVYFGGGWGSGNVQILLTSYDSGALGKTAQELLTQMRTIPELTDVRSNAEALRPEIEIEPDLARAAEQGVSVESIAHTAVVATIGDTDANSPKFDLSDRQIPIAVRLAPEFRNKMSIIRNLKVQGSNGKLIPLSSVAKVRMDSGTFTVERYDRARQVSLSAKFGSKFSLGQALTKIHQLPAYRGMPSSISDHPTGDVEEQQDMFGGFGYAIFTGVLLIYGVLVLLFRGFFQPFTIMMSLPLSLGGAVIGLWALQKPVDMYALIGIVMLMGLVTKNAILLVEYCLVQMDRGIPRRQAIFLAGRTRMRPIIMTTTAMIAGMLPIAIGFGAGAEARAPMAIAVVGGLFVSTVLTLVVVPVVFSLMDDLQKWLASIFHSQENLVNNTSSKNTLSDQSLPAGKAGNETGSR
jgi:multidrug efflux pump subunit AcrB